jgi:predicted CXXCH cytochrome family protein
MRSVLISLLGAVLLLGARVAPAAADACWDCHELAKISPGGTVVHPPFAEKDCTACHADHGDRERLELVEEGIALCAQCHDFKEAAFLAAHRRIAPTGKAACTGCHDPHRSAQKRLLRAGLHPPVKEGRCEACHRTDGKLKIPLNQGFCLLCHDRTQFSRAVPHDPVRKGRCFDCHDPHGSAHRALLRADFAPDREVRDETKDHALCFLCHPREKLLGDAAPLQTRFADGGRNLHLQHVKGEGHRSERAFTQKGLTCRNCHEIHSAPNAALTRTELECGSSLCLKLEFRRNDGGGECAASCHGERMRYRNAAPAAPQAPPGP